MYVCTECGENLNPSGVTKDEYVARVAREEELERNTPVDDIPDGMSEKETQDYIGKCSQERVVKLGFLLTFTVMFECWEWTAADVILKIIKPLTKNTRCRFVELPCMKGRTGEAKTFISYAQAGAWGDLVAALLDGGADRERCVWLDVFAIRQWPSYRFGLCFHHSSL